MRAMTNYQNVCSNSLHTKQHQNFKGNSISYVFLYLILPGYSRGGGNLYFRLDIILVKGLSKHTLNTYFPGMKIDPKYAFLQAFSLICLSCPVQDFQYDQKHILFSNFASFCTPKAREHAWSSRKVQDS